MTNEPVDLDRYRRAAANLPPEICRQAHRSFQVDRHAKVMRVEELVVQLMAEPSQALPEAVAKAQYLLRRYARTTDVRNAGLDVVVESVLHDLDRLSRR
jgi:hypothetical protein